MKWKNFLAVVFVVALLLAVATTVSADNGGVAPSGFCNGGVAWVVRGQTTLTDPRCSGIYVLDKENQQSRYTTFAAAEAARGGKDATYWFEPPTATPTAKPTATPTVAVGDRVARLIALDRVYRSRGWQAWLEAAGAKFQVGIEARQPEEEVVSDSSGTHIVVSGLQIRGTCEVPYPMVVTTDRPGEVVLRNNSRTYQPDLRNPSVLYTNVVLRGQGTVWADGSNWGQLKPPSEAQATVTTSPTVVPPTATPTSTMPKMTSMPTYTAQPTYTALPTYTPYPTQQPPVAKLVTSAPSQGLVVPPAQGRNFLNSTVGASRLYWWGLILILLAVAAVGVGIYFLIKFWDRFWGWFTGLFRRRPAPPVRQRDAHGRFLPRNPQP